MSNYQVAVTFGIAGDLHDGSYIVDGIRFERPIREAIDEVCSNKLGWLTHAEKPRKNKWRLVFIAEGHSASSVLDYVNTRMVGVVKSCPAIISFDTVVLTDTQEELAERGQALADERFSLDALWSQRAKAGLK